MNKLTKIGKSSPFFLIAFWSLLLLANFLPSIPQPSVIVGYLWKIEFALAGLIALTLLVALTYPSEKFSLVKFSSREILWVILPVSLFIIWSGFSLSWAESPRSAAHHTLLWACYALFYFLVRQIVVRPRLLNLSLKVCGAVVAILGLLCLIEYLTTAAELSVNISTRFSKYAEAIAALTPLFIALAISRKSRHPFLFGAVAIVGWLGIIYSLGRTQLLAGLIGATVFAVLAFLAARREISLKRAVIFSSVFILATVFSQISFTSENSQQTTLKRFSGDEASRTSLQVRFLFWQFALEDFKHHPLNGVGADNYAASYSRARESYAAAHADDPNTNLGEDYLPERAHNEYLQILAELGIVGFAIFGWLLLGICRCAFSIRAGSASLVSLASLAGLAAFLVSSIASSYSFRVPANGACFFFALALAASGLLETKENEERSFGFDSPQLKPILLGAGLTICAATLIFSSVRGASLMYLQYAFGDRETAEANMQTAIYLDGGDASFRYYYGLELYNQTRAAEAIPHLRFAIDNGMATSIAYFNLAAAQIVSRRAEDAEQTFAEALRVYPRSVFLRTAHASFLKETNRDGESEAEYKIAFETNPKQAASWQTAQIEGMKQLTINKNGSENLVGAMELYPIEAVYALLDFQRQNNPNLVRR